MKIYSREEIDKLNKELNSLARKANSRLRSVESKELTWLSAYKEVGKRIESNDILKSSKVGKGKDSEVNRIRQSWKTVPMEDKLKALDQLMVIDSIEELKDESVQKSYLEMFNKFKTLKEFKDLNPNEAMARINSYIAFTKTYTFKMMKEHFDSEQMENLLEESSGKDMDLREYFTEYENLNKGKEVNFIDFKNYIENRETLNPFLIPDEEIELDEDDLNGGDDFLFGDFSDYDERVEMEKRLEEEENVRQGRKIYYEELTF